MRKELTVFIETTEPDIELGIKAILGDNVLLNMNGIKFAVSIAGLREALQEVEYFAAEEGKIDAEPSVVVLTGESFSFNEGS